MADRETIHTEVARIKRLRADYDALAMDINSRRTSRRITHGMTNRALCLAITLMTIAKSMAILPV